MTRFRTAASMVLAIGMIGSAGIAKEPVRRLKALTTADLERTKVLGSGCSWSKTSDGPIMFAATDNIAVIKPRTGVVGLKPHPAAKDMFPFTYDRWIGGGIEVGIVKAGRTKTIGTELHKTPAMLLVTIDGRTSRVSGVLNCGS